MLAELPDEFLLADVSADLARVLPPGAAVVDVGLLGSVLPTLDVSLRRDERSADSAHREAAERELHVARAILAIEHGLDPVEERLGDDGLVLSLRHLPAPPDHSVVGGVLEHGVHRASLDGVRAVAVPE